MAIDTLLVGGTTNCYIVYDDDKNGFIIDPGAEAEKILAYVKNLGLAIEGILLTHGHGDHISALNKVRDALGVKVYMHKDELENFLSQSPQFVAMLGGELPNKNPDVLLQDGDIISFKAGDVRFSLRRVIRRGASVTYTAIRFSPATPCSKVPSAARIFPAATYLPLWNL